MRWLHQLRMMVRSVFRSRAIDSELGDEIRFYIEREQKRASRGKSPQDASHAARMLFGSVDNAQEQSRDERPGVNMRDFTKTFALDCTSSPRIADLRSLPFRSLAWRLAQRVRCSANYFNVLGVRAALGRTFATNEEQAGNERMVIIGDALWRSRFGADSGIVGQSIQLNGSAYTVVGVMPDGISYPSVNYQTWVHEVRTLDNIVERSKMQRKLTTILIGGFSLAALLLSAVGVYGVVTYGVTQRVREFGIRTALGATSQHISGLVIRQGALLAGMGVAAGLVLAIATVNVASSLVYGVAPTDVVSLVGATVLMLSTACIASYLPARRAAKVHPASIMRGN